MIVIWRCFGDLEQAWARSVCEEQRIEWEIEQDLAIDLELDPFEETSVETVPTHMLDLLGWAHG